jgi:hypothetical protein
MYLEPGSMSTVMGAPLTLLLAVNGLITPYVEGLVAPLVVQRF